MKRNILARFAITFCLLAAFAGFAVVQSVNSVPEVNAGVQDVRAITIPQTAMLIGGSLIYTSAAADDTAAVVLRVPLGAHDNTTFKMFLIIDLILFH